MYFFFIQTIEVLNNIPTRITNCIYMYNIHCTFAVCIPLGSLKELHLLHRFKLKLLIISAYIGYDVPLQGCIYCCKNVVRNISRCEIYCCFTPPSFLINKQIFFRDFFTDNNFFIYFSCTFTISYIDRYDVCSLAVFHSKFLAIKVKSRNDFFICYY